MKSTLKIIKLKIMKVKKINGIIKNSIVLYKKKANLKRSK